MANRDSEHQPAGVRSRSQWVLDAAANAYFTEHTRAFLQTGLGRLTERDFCAGCPAALLCAAAEVELNRLAPSTGPGGSAGARNRATRTLAGLSITTVDRLDSADVCFGKIVRAISQGFLFEPAGRPNPADPLDPTDQQLLWLADRVRTYTRDVAGRIASGQYAAD
jgi:hypothetical protein